MFAMKFPSFLEEERTTNTWAWRSQPCWPRAGVVGKSPLETLSSAYTCPAGVWRLRRRAGAAFCFEGEDCGSLLRSLESCCFSSFVEMW